MIVFIGVGIGRVHFGTFGKIVHFFEPLICLWCLSGMTKQKPHTGLDYFREHPLPYPVAYRKNARISIVVEAVGYLWGELSVRYQMLREDRHLVRRTVLYKPAENLIKKFCVPEIPSILAEQEAKKEWGKALVIGRRKAKREAKERQREANDKN